MRLRPRQVWGAGVVVGTLGLLALVGLASEEAPFDVKDDTGGVQGPDWLGAILIAFIVLVIAAGFVLIVTAQRAPSIGRPPRRPSMRKRLLVLLVAFAVSVVLQTSRGSDEEGDAPPPEAEPSEPEPERPDRPGDPPWVAFILGGAVLGVLAAAALTRRHMVSQDEGDDQAQSRDAVLSIDESLEHLLAGGDDREAILAAYATLLQRLAAAGSPRRPDEAPGEYLTRVLHRLDVRPEPLTDLTALFAEARFSVHPMGADHRRRAIEALAAARADLLRDLLRDPARSEAGG
jgi:Domain of unknown function (DUF4129)